MPGALYTSLHTLHIASSPTTTTTHPPTHRHPSPLPVQPLDKLQRAEFTKEAQQHVQPGFKLVMQEKVDKGLMGGFILEFEDRLVDMSVKKKLEEFNNLVGTIWNCCCVQDVWDCGVVW